jgi:ATP-dependent RNA helicase DeaD
VDQDHPEAGLGAGAQGVPAGDAPTTPPAGGATRSQHVVHTLPHDWGTIPQFLGPVLERLDPEAAGTQLLVVTPDAETALAVADAALGMREGTGTPVLAVTRVERAVRQLRARPVPAIAADPAALAALLRASALKLDGVRAVVFAWADDILASPAAEELDQVLGEVPKEAERTLVAAELTGEVEELIERALRRPRRLAPAAAAGAPLTLSYVPTAPSARPATLRRVLDELDPPTATVLVASAASEAEVRRTVRALGYVVEGDAEEAAAEAGSAAEAQRQLGAAAAAPAARVRVARLDDAAPLAAQEALVVLYDLPGGRDARERLSAARAVQLVALPQPRQLAALRDLAGAAPKPLALRDVARREDARDTALRAELRAELARGLPARELRLLEELLEAHDGVEVAAAAVRLLERERARRQTQAPAAPAQAAQGATQPGAGGMTRLFVSVGTRDGVRPGDLVGAISNEAGITSDRIGKIELRESFSLVEVASADAERVIEKVSGIMIRGRKAAVRAERDGGGDRPARGDRPPRGDRPERRDAGDRRPAGGGERRGGAGGGGRAFDARRDGPRGFGGADDRPVRERAEQRSEWAERAARLQRAKRRAPGAPGADAEG